MNNEEKLKEIAGECDDFDAFMRKVRDATLPYKEVSKDNLNQVVFIESEWLTPVRIIKVNKKLLRLNDVEKNNLQFTKDINLKISDNITYLLERHQKICCNYLIKFTIWAKLNKLTTY